MLRLQRWSAPAVSTIALFGYTPRVSLPGGGSPPLAPVATSSIPIKPETKFDVKDVVGSYYFGDGLGANCYLTIEPTGTFYFKWRGCLGVYAQNTGRVELTGEMLKLNLTAPNRTDGFVGTPEHFYPVSWGQRLYLVSDEQMLGFCEKLRKGWKGEEWRGRGASVYIRNDPRHAAQELPPVSGKPAIPALFQQYLTKPFETEVVGSRGNRFVVDRGALDGLARGAMLCVAPPGSRWDWVRVEETTDHTAIVKKWNEDASVSSVIGYTPIPLKSGTKLVPAEPL